MSRVDYGFEGIDIHVLEGQQTRRFSELLTLYDDATPMNSGTHENVSLSLYSVTSIGYQAEFLGDFAARGVEMVTTGGDSQTSRISVSSTWHDKVAAPAKLLGELRRRCPR